jgi:hypothetical protein
MSGKVPGWLVPFIRFSEYLKESRNVVILAHWGAYFSIEHVELMEVVEGFPFASDDSKPTPEQREVAERRATLAKDERDKGFPLLHGHALVGMWGALEAFIEDVCVACMEEFPRSLESNALKNIKISLSDFLILSGEDRLRYLVTEIQRAKRAGLRAGVSIFEDLLGAIEIGGDKSSCLSGEVDKRVKDSLYEAQQIRNALAHRGGIADRRLCGACPGLNLTPGDRISLDLDYLDHVYDAMRIYAITIQNRICSLLGREVHLRTIQGFEGALSVKYPPPL